ncbi:MAG: ABC transporter ATP-binding protein [Brevibacterium sp.]|uniref:ATP-binding cassette domain-containing protein n=1 Tax=Brevibacterium sp. TaxID=1701 RepID=UPI0026486B32|nr:ABC transporter ATP-binding protein [Brevibacterium sp.]MDN5806640.1 ABC transporter ATP-binding protein [Brevibacterium sp.]MDN5833642.1 ABC transporter ATP-binding protein [Brevibacterium sp.]MDN5875241.1 ABC transporter ATP-binding protein [Brevibacterium sp.]MDN5910514.1 ABC transporter ATP-binding protein [Brevibacterium sp.]MDN6133812.1 ABC transporter ATP-binding protein [Brevibacterium sp.]
MTELSFANVSITYRSASTRGDVTAVSDISLDLPTGATLGIAGESGSGKSTLIMSALRLLPKSTTIDGQVRLGGKDIRDLSFGEIRAVRWAQASIVFQGALHSLNPVREVGGQIIEALEHHAKDAWMTPAKRRDRMFELLEEVDLDQSKAVSYPHELSGGQKQRIMIAMALACEPDIIIADEPTTALDVIVQKQILEGMARLVGERGISLLMISHDLAVLSAVCENLAIMRHGKLVEYGPSDQVCLAPEEDYTKQLANAFPQIGDAESRMNPRTLKPAEVRRAQPYEMTDEVVLEAKNLSVSFDTRQGRERAVRGVDLALHKAEILAVVGQSGSGKTTLARSLLGLQEVDAGSQLDFAGTALPRKAKALRAFRRQVQMILQDPSGSLNPKRSVYEAVVEGLRVQKITDDEYARVIGALEAAELTPAADYLESIPQELSGGQRQRVVIAGALALDPQVLIADEPVASLDASVRGEILSLFLALKKNLGMSALIITHDLGLAWNIADTVAVMKKGEIVEYGDVDTVLSDPQHAYTQELLAAVPRLGSQSLVNNG